MSNHPVIDLGITSNLGSPNKGCGCFGIIIALVILVVSVYFLGQDSNTKTNNSSVTLEWQPACGSSARSGSVWYSVMGNRQALKTVKEKYCGDAFITSRGNLQAASFTSKAASRAICQSPYQSNRLQVLGVVLNQHLENRPPPSIMIIILAEQG